MSYATFASLLSAPVWLSASAVLLTAGDVVFRLWQKQPFWGGFEGTFAIYMLGILCLIFSFFSENIALATTAAIILNSLGYLLAAYLLWGETVSGVQLAGIGLGLVAIGLMQA